MWTLSEECDALCRGEGPLLTSFDISCYKTTGAQKSFTVTFLHVFLGLGVCLQLYFFLLEYCVLGAA